VQLCIYFRYCNYMTHFSIITAAIVLLSGFGNGTAHADIMNAAEDDHIAEYGLSVAPTYFVHDEEWGVSVHVHSTWMLPHTAFGIGIGYERIFDDHGHNTLGVLFSYRPFNDFSLVVSPGITIEDTAPQSVHGAFHIEALYEFDVGGFHIGPACEYAIEHDDVHVSIGLHVGFGL